MCTVAREIAIRDVVTESTSVPGENPSHAYWASLESRGQYSM